jgi:hypothetical protein
VVTRWQVQGAHGPVRLVVLRGDVRPGGLSTLKRVQASAEQEVRGEGRQKLQTRLKIQKGDAVGLQLSIGAYANAPYSEGAWLEAWDPPLGAESRPSREGVTATATGSATRRRTTVPRIPAVTRAAEQAAVREGVNIKRRP